MTQTERRIWLIRQLLEESPRYGGWKAPEEEQAQKDLLRALLNVRPPMPVGQDFLTVQDEYLSAERDRKGVVDIHSLPPLRCDERLVVWQGDITTLNADAIVNAANSRMLGCFVPGHNCIDNAIHTFAGVQLRLCCNEMMAEQGREEPAGQAKITPAFNLPSRYILHTVGPVIQGPVSQRDRELLASCYRSCLELAAAKGLESVAFCCISTGEFHFPNREAARIAVKAVQSFLQAPSPVKKVIFNVFKDIDLQIYRELLGEAAAGD